MATLLIIGLLINQQIEWKKEYGTYDFSSDKLLIILSVLVLDLLTIGNTYLIVK
jgi:hypothetical protein